MERSNQITKLLIAWGNGDESALDVLMTAVYDELHRMARAYMHRQRVGHTLQTTALLNEAYLRLIDSSKVQWQNRAHFFAVSAQLMRRILVDFARAQGNQKRGGSAERVSLDRALEFSADRGSDLVALDDALKTLAELNTRQAQIVELRYFGGLTEGEVAEVLKTSERTIRRDWSLARAWLYRELSKND